jgi:hypothetical protein
MPFGTKESNGKSINFDEVYNEIIKPSIAESKLEPIRADEEVVGGIIHKPMFERLLLCDYAIADLTTANANVFYELGVRHAIRPYTTILICAKEGHNLPFDIRMSRVLYYSLGKDGSPNEIDINKRGLAKILNETVSSENKLTDSPLFQLIGDFKPPSITHLKTDIFLEKMQQSNKTKEEIDMAKRDGESELKKIEEKLDVKNTEYDVVISLFLAYRSIKAWSKMIELAGKMSKPLSETVMVQEQLALALNRAGQSESAEKVLLDLIQEKGAGSSETYGILGRVYKDRWENKLQNKNDESSLFLTGLLNKSIDAYMKGFEMDWRDAYPGINALALMEINNPMDERIKKIFPVVNYSLERKLESKRLDYWDHATLLEIAIIEKDYMKLNQYLMNIVSMVPVPEPWQIETTARNIKMIDRAREERKEDTDNEKMVVKELSNLKLL